MIIAKQRQGVLPKDLEAQMLQLAIYAPATYPLAFAQITRMVTGKHPSEKAFQDDWRSFLDKVGGRLTRKAA
jgi:TetR/AcrR family transcriptional regulator